MSDDVSSTSPILYARGNGVKQDLQEIPTNGFAIRCQGRRQGRCAEARRSGERHETGMSSKAPAPRSTSCKAAAAGRQGERHDYPRRVDDRQGVNFTASIDMKKAIRNIRAILNNNGFRRRRAGWQTWAAKPSLR